MGKHRVMTFQNEQLGTGICLHVVQKRLKKSSVVFFLKISPESPLGCSPVRCMYFTKSLEMVAQKAQIAGLHQNSGNGNYIGFFQMSPGID